MNTETSTPSPYQAARTLLKQLQEKFAVFRDCQPLAIGTDKKIIKLMPEVDRKVLRMALGIHTNSMRYLKAMSKAETRFDLEGQAAGDITEEHRTHAAQMLQERIKKDAERHKAERKAQQAQREAEKVERQRTEKLQQLAAKFSRGK